MIAKAMTKAIRPAIQGRATEQERRQHGDPDDDQGHDDARQDRDDCRRHRRSSRLTRGRGGALAATSAAIVMEIVTKIPMGMKRRNSSDRAGFRLDGCRDPVVGEGRGHARQRRATKVSQFARNCRPSLRKPTAQPGAADGSATCDAPVSAWLLPGDRRWRRRRREGPCGRGDPRQRSLGLGGRCHGPSGAAAGAGRAAAARPRQGGGRPPSVWPHSSRERAGRVCTAAAIRCPWLIDPLALPGTACMHSSRQDPKHAPRSTDPVVRSGSPSRLLVRGPSTTPNGGWMDPRCPGGVEVRTWRP